MIEVVGFVFVTVCLAVLFGMLAAILLPFIPAFARDIGLWAVEQRHAWERARVEADR